MSDSFPESLSQFTPNAGRLDRDALLFAAGRNSARPNRVWQGLSAVLVATQLVTLACVWPRPMDLRPGATDSIVRQSVPVEQHLPIEPDQRHIWSVRLELDELMLEQSVGKSIVVMSSEPELRAFGPAPDSIFN